MKIINIEQLIANSVDNYRVGYNPAEVRKLMAKAYEAGKSNAKEIAKEIIDRIS